MFKCALILFTKNELHIKIENGVVAATRILANRGKEHEEWDMGSGTLSAGENRFTGDNEL